MGMFIQRLFGGTQVKLSGHFQMDQQTATAGEAENYYFATAPEAHYFFTPVNPGTEGRKRLLLFKMRGKENQAPDPSAFQSGTQAPDYSFHFWQFWHEMILPSRGPISKSGRSARAIPYYPA